RGARPCLRGGGGGEYSFRHRQQLRGFNAVDAAPAIRQELGGAVIVDSPIRSPEEEVSRPLSPPNWGNKKIYPAFDAALARFRLMPTQTCENNFLVEFIGRHSLMPAEKGWTWKFDGAAIGARRFGEPFREYLQAVRCRAALIF